MPHPPVVITDTGTLCYDADFDPYGGEHAFTNNCNVSNVYKFEGKERDTETATSPGADNGDDYFGARYYSNRFGRWLSADWSSVPVAVPYANLTNPQTLNLYSMVSDDPESFADLDGHGCSWNLNTGDIGCSGSTWIPGHQPDQQGEGAGPSNTGTGGAASSVDGEVEAQQHAGENTNDQSQNQPCCSVDPTIKKAIMDSVNASNSPTDDDQKGGFHEEGGQAIEITTGDTVTLPAVPGKYSDPRVPGGTATVDPTNAVNPNMKSEIQSLLVTWHVHPKGRITEINGNKMNTFFFVQEPSNVDKQLAQSLGLNIVVGAGNKQVYFYDNSHIIKKESLKHFMNAP